MLRRRNALERALVAIAAGDDDAQCQLHELNEREWAALPTAAEFHGLTLHVNELLCEGIGAPPEIRERIDDWSRRAAMADLRAEAELAVVAEALDRQGCSWLTFKGPSLASFVYRSPYLRTYADIDLLVDVDSLATAIDCLIELGARPRERNFELMTTLGRAELSLDMPAGTEIDLHWHPVMSRATRRRFRWPARELLDRRRQVSLVTSGLKVFVLDPTDQLLTVATHHSLGGGLKLIWCRDVIEIISNDPPDWTALVERARRWRIGLSAAAALRRAAATVAAPVPAEVIEALAGGSWWAVLTALETIAPAGLEPHRHLKGSHPIAATRDTASASLSALVRVRIAEYRRSTPGRSPEELRLERGTRQAWISDAQASEAQTVC